MGTERAAMPSYSRYVVAKGMQSARNDQPQATILTDFRCFTRSNTSTSHCKLQFTAEKRMRAGATAALTQKKLHELIRVGLGG